LFLFLLEKLIDKRNKHFADIDAHVPEKTKKVKKSSEAKHTKQTEIDSECDDPWYQDAHAGIQGLKAELTSKFYF